MGSICFPLSQREREQIKEIEVAFFKGKFTCFSDDTEIRLRDVLTLLVVRGVILPMDIDNTNAYHLVGSFEDFWDWVDDQEAKAKKITRREYKIALISAFLGWFIPWFVTTIVPQISILLKGGG